MANMNPLTKKKLSKVPTYDRTGYIYENGLDREDAELLRNNPDEFNRRVGGTITKNLKEASDRGWGVRNYNQERAAAKTKAKRQVADDKKKDNTVRRLKNAWNATTK